ncbi:uncharacterized protein [Spinacia oleracea]|uniref:Uncharacterized protein n=1 Tax=Spinacia oleracea TaxID=3562 RepID=A0A9R0IWN7_SPIOL|nr:uncharacterized protein LOC110796036 [Spinacia oleracea]
MPIDDTTLAKENTDGPEKAIDVEPQVPKVDNADDVGANKGKEKIADSLPIVPKFPFPHRMLNMGKLKCTQITLQMADRSIKYPLGILEDVPVRVRKFYIPVDFVVLDMEEDSQIPIILGRPFLCTAGAVIDVKSGSLTLSVGDDTFTFNLTNALKSPMLENTCCRIDIVE